MRACIRKRQTTTRARTANAIYGISKQSVTYIPTSQGTLAIPPVELAWWNLRTDSPNVAMLPGREMAIGPGTAGPQSNAAPAAPAAAGAGLPATHAVAPTQREANRWTWLAGGLAALAVVALSIVVFRRSRRRGSSSTPTPAAITPARLRQSALRALHQACIANDPHSAARALLDLARAEWPTNPPRGLRELGARLDAGQDEIRALDRKLYGTGASPWEGGSLWSRFSRGLPVKDNEAGREDDGLEALY